MGVALSRILLFITGVALLGLALLPSMARPVAAAPLMLVTETTTIEPATRTSTPTPTATEIAPILPTSTATATPEPPVIPASPTATATALVTTTPTQEPPSDDNDRPTATPTSAPPPQIADPAVTKSVNHSTVRVGETVEFTIRVTNLGNAVANDVVVEDSLPSFLSLDGVSVTRGEVSVSGATVRVVIGAIAPGETVTVTITARVIALATPPDNSNVATISTSSEGDNPDNNRSDVALNTEDTAPTAAPPVAVPPASLPNTGAPGESGPLLLAMLGLGLIAASLFARRKRV